MSDVSPAAGQERRKHHVAIIRCNDAEARVLPAGSWPPEGRWV